MAGYLLDAGTTIMCPHGGTVTVVPQTLRVGLSGKPPLVVDDKAAIAGCGLNVSGSPSPCLRVQWKEPAKRVYMNSSAALLSTSVALCANAGGASQGNAILSGYQTRVRGQ